MCGSQIGSKDSYTLTGQSNIRGRLRRIPSIATSNVELPLSRNIPSASSQKDGLVGVELRHEGVSREHGDDILAANGMNHGHDVERPQPARYNR